MVKHFADFGIFAPKHFADFGIFAPKHFTDFGKIRLKRPRMIRTKAVPKQYFF